MTRRSFGLWRPGFILLRKLKLKAKNVEIGIGIGIAITVSIGCASLKKQTWGAAIPIPTIAGCFAYSGKLS